MSNELLFDLTVPLAKSDRSDGWYITGVAAGTEVDRENDSLTREAIERLAQQINTGTIPFRDHHNKDSIAEDVGYVTKGEVDEKALLRVEVKLDEDNPYAQYLWKKLEKGKQYGMSIHGKSLGWYQDVEKSTGKRIRRHPIVLVDEISATTRPMFTPSLGTVLRKAIDEASTSFAAGEEMSAPTQNGEAVTTPESSAPENDTAEVTKSISPSEELVKSLMANDDFVTLIKATVQEATKVTQPVTETTDSVEDSTEVSKGEAETVNVAEIVKSAVEEASARFTEQLEALTARIPEVQQPNVLVQEQINDEEIMKSLRADPRQALRVGLAARHGELERLQ